MRPQMRVCLCEIQNSVYISFNCGQNEMIFFSCFDFLICYLHFYEIITGTDVSFWVISLQGIIFMTFISLTEISFLSKWPEWNNSCNEFYFEVFHVSFYKRLTRHQTVMKSHVKKPFNLRVFHYKILHNLVLLNE